jgi:DNA-binding NarL/FixJ family response regulator
VKQVAIIAPSEVIRAGLEAVVSSDPDLAVVASSPDESLLDGQEDVNVDVLLLVSLRHTEEALSSITSLSEQLNVPVVVLTDGFDIGWAGAALRSGARAILSSEATSAEILSAIEAVSLGLVVLPGAVGDALLTEGPAQVHSLPVGEVQKLTPREMEILGMIAEGLGNKEIAWRLDISEHTVKFHIGSIFTKLGAHSRTEAVTIGVRRGLIMV